MDRWMSPLWPFAPIPIAVGSGAAAIVWNAWVVGFVLLGASPFIAIWACVRLVAQSRRRS